MLLFSSIHSCIINIKRHIQSPTVCSAPEENKAYEEEGSASDDVSWWPYWPDSKEHTSKVLQPTLPSLFSPQTLLFGNVSLHKGGKHRAIFKMGFSQHRYHAVETLPKAVPSTVLLECNDQKMRRFDLSFFYFPKGLILCLRRAFFLPAEQGLFLLGTGSFPVPAGHSKQKEWGWSVLVQVSQDFKPIFSIICSYTVHAIAAIRVRLRARGTPPRKKPTNPKSCSRKQTAIHYHLPAAF